MQKIYIIIVLASFYCIANAQTPTWQLLPNSPSVNFRHDDIYFTNASIGWAVNVNGYIYKTTDGGLSWTTLLHQPMTAFRCVGFADSLNGFAGNLGAGSWNPNTTDTIPLYKTADGGITWTPVTIYNGQMPKGLCGMRIISDSIIVACGRTEGPTYFVRSLDKGNTWTSIDLSSYIKSAVDLHFVSRDTGFVVGGSTNNYQTWRGKIIYTTDGGNTWQIQFVSQDTSEECWKVDFPSRNVGYVSMEATNDTIFFLKTIDGGLTWQEKIFQLQQYFSQGIGFVNDTVGWMGGVLGNNNVITYQTMDGGNTWAPFSVGISVNRFRFLSDTLGYAVGKRVYKYTSSNVSVNGIFESINLNGYSLFQNSPNPFIKATEIKYTIPKREKVEIIIYDYAGRKIMTLVDEEELGGAYTKKFELPFPVSSIFICSMTAGSYTKAIVMFSEK